jgi:RNA polymerase sigma-70 factor (sigma-E family)
VSVGTRSGERDEAVAALWSGHRVELTRLALGMTGEIGRAEELVQDAFVALLSRWGQLRDPSAALHYLRRVVVNGGRGEWRRRRRDEVRTQQAGAAQEIGAAEHRRRESVLVEVQVDVFRALVQLPVRKRACVLLRHYADLGEAEVADLLNVSVGTVKSQTSRGLQQLSELLSEQGEK